MKILQEQLDYVLAHINDRPRTKVARDAGVSMTMLYRIVRENGGELRHELSVRDPKTIEIVRKHYPTMTASEIGAMYGMTKSRVNKIAREIGVCHNEETWKRIKEISYAKMKQSRYKIDWHAIAKKSLIKRRLDEYRVWEGKPQLTRLKLKSITKKSYKAKYYLIHNYGYIETDEPYTLMYDSDTRRLEHERYNENYYSEKYKLKFISAYE